MLRPLGAAALSPGSYGTSLARFAAGLTGRVREMVAARAAASAPNPNAETAEKLLQRQVRS